MGYRSDVKLITTDKGWEKIERAVKQADETSTLTICKRTLLGGGKYILAEWNDIKWYDYQFADIKALMNTLGQLDNEGIPYEFMRIGEDTEDIQEQHGSAEDLGNMPHLELRRSIELYYW